MILATGEEKSEWPLGEVKLIKVLIYVSSLNGQGYQGPYLNIEVEKHQIKIYKGVLQAGRFSGRSAKYGLGVV